MFHFRLLLSFAVINIILVAADIMTDISTAWSFFSSDNYNWGIFSTIPIFAPFLVRIVISVINFDSWLINPWVEIQQILWNFPLLIPLR